MTVTERSRDRVRDWLDEFRERYRDFERVDKEWEYPADAYDGMVERFERDANGGAGVWVTDDDGAVLMVRDEGREGWGDPGGKREAGESFEEAARREVREETDVTCEITGLMEVHVLEIDDAGDPERPSLWSCIAIFAGEYVDGESRAEEGEIADVAWFDEMPDEVMYPEVADRPVPASE